MTQENIVKIYLAAYNKLTPDALDEVFKWQWDDVYILADRIIQEIEPLLDAYEMSETK